jgi:hypothetical protein
VSQFLQALTELGRAGDLHVLKGSLVLGVLVFRCATTGQTFPSQFRATALELQSIPRDAKMQLRCDACKQRHDFLLAECAVEDSTGGGAR